MAELSTLVIKVDLGCSKCYNKIRQVLCKYNCKIRSKTFDKENNLVIVTGFFDPCEFSDKLRCKAGKAIQSIEIVKKEEPKVEEPPPAPAPEPEPAPAPPAPEPEPAPPEPEPEPAPAPAPAEPEPEPAPAPAPAEPEPAPIVFSEPIPQPKMPIPSYVPGYPPPPYFGPQYGICCEPCYQGYDNGPCHHGGGGGYRMAEVVPPPPSYDYYGRRAQCNCGCGGNYRRCVSPCEYISEENPNTCNIM